MPTTFIAVALSAGFEALRRGVGGDSTLSEVNRGVQWFKENPDGFLSWVRDEYGDEIATICERRGPVEAEQFELDA